MGSREECGTETSETSAGTEVGFVNSAPPLAYTLPGTGSSEGLGKRARELDKLAIVLTVSLPTITQAPHAMLRAA